MTPKLPQDVDALQQRLVRLSAALGQAPQAAGTAASSGPRGVARGVMWTGAGLSLSLVGTGIGMGSVLVAMLGVALGALVVGGAGAVLSRLPAQLAPKDPTRAHIGMGAEVAADAVIEPGATVEMGATVGSGAVVKRGAVVRMGASVRAQAVLEPGAVVGWGAEVHKGATVGRDATLGAGVTVKAGASVPAGMRLMPGTTWAQGAAAAPLAAAAPGAAVDPREARLEVACERLQAELRLAPQGVRTYLGASEQTVQALRSTCLGLLERERTLRQECSAEAFAFLAQERTELEQRIRAATDASVRRSLEQALAALDEQQLQRTLLQQRAERLDAELTRLLWTLEGMGPQLVRLRTAGAEAASAPEQAVLQSMQQLHQEIDAITEALEHVARGDAQEAWRGEPLRPLDEDAPGAPPRHRSRERP